MWLFGLDKSCCVAPGAAALTTRLLDTIVPYRHSDLLWCLLLSLVICSLCYSKRFSNNCVFLQFFIFTVKADTLS